MSKFQPYHETGAEIERLNRRIKDQADGLNRAHARINELEGELASERSAIIDLRARLRRYKTNAKSIGNYAATTMEHTVTGFRKMMEQMP